MNIERVLKEEAIRWIQNCKVSGFGLVLDGQYLDFILMDGDDPIHLRFPTCGALQWTPDETLDQAGKKG